jgi:hypothetical protein
MSDAAALSWAVARMTLPVYDQRMKAKSAAVQSTATANGDELGEVEHRAPEAHDDRVVAGAHELRVGAPEDQGHVLERDRQPDRS